MGFSVIVFIPVRRWWSGAVVGDYWMGLPSRSEGNAAQEAVICVLMPHGFTMQDTETFPIYKERFPIQLLNFIRFSRIQDVGELAKVQFEADVIISPQNEYEVLQLVMADLRERLQGYRENQVIFLSAALPKCYPSFVDLATPYRPRQYHTNGDHCR